MAARILNGDDLHPSPWPTKSPKGMYCWVCRECQTAGDWKKYRGQAATGGETHNKKKHPTVTERI